MLPDPNQTGLPVDELSLVLRETSLNLRKQIPARLGARKEVSRSNVPSFQILSRRIDTLVDRRSFDRVAFVSFQNRHFILCHILQIS
jgi:hypothetical protein